ncbi:hypothetical protein OSH11_01425 [Kaistia dalseonensis]|uniref:YD repeat-containing protein n=1 Tax=Kaistia dalseonensis TaxID=410840 RepID=A0ABU0H1Y6_9HYPH|nr:hypothetical protein [Kaistia dalseonensis]MCX5493355.1 hypothetical protein [Kaistia dalseonensis]MDQ0435913.1 YD repeat-containing protein [Kaistia dalseonensis]
MEPALRLDRRDGENRLISVVTATGSTSYAYGPDGGRAKTVSTVGANPATTT